QRRSRRFRRRRRDPPRAPRRHLPGLLRLHRHAQAGDRNPAPGDGSRGPARRGRLMADALEARVISALAGIRNPRLENDLISSGMVRDLEVTPDGRVTFTFLLAPDDPATLVRAARSAVRAVEGAAEVNINVSNPAAPAQATHGPPQSAGMPAPPSPMEQPNLGRIVAVSSGKGGGGQSTVAANVDVALAESR